MRVESVDTPSLLELRAIVAQRLQAYGTFNTWPGPPGSSSLLVIQVHGSKIATSEEKVAN